jgi:nucleoside-diphosphate-sugar epimerase
MGKQFEVVTHEINLVATVALAERARKAGVRSFVFASSCSIYGQADDTPRTERSEVNPLTAYAKSKILAERELVRLATNDFRVTCLRFATACGMSERLRLDLVLNDFVAGAVAARRIRILSDGTPWRPLIDVNDMARAIEWAIGRDGDDALIVNAGRNDANYSVRQLAEAVAAEIPDTTVSINREAQPDKRSYRVDFSLFERLAPDHTPRITLAESIVGLRNGLASMTGLTENVQDSPLIRLHTLSGLQRDGMLSDQLRWTARRAETRA